MRPGEAARSGGWGYVLGDEGSGYWIGRAALRAVLRESDRRGPRTALSGLLLQHFGVTHAQGLIQEVYNANLKPAAIGALAQCVQSAFSEGDAVATGILRAAANELEAGGAVGRTAAGFDRTAVRLHPRGRHLSSGAVGPAGARAPAAGLPLPSAACSCSIASRRRARSRSRCRKRVAARACLLINWTDGRSARRAAVRYDPQPGRHGVFERSAAARALARRIAAAVHAKPRLVLGLPTGKTPVALYHELASLHAHGHADFSQVTTFNLDEFLGIPPSHPGSYRSFMERHLFSRVNIPPEHTNFLDGSTTDPDAECARYEKKIADVGWIDLQVLGIGTNGHIGFNEPARVLQSRTHRVVLKPETRRSNASLSAAIRPRCRPRPCRWGWPLS